MPLNINVSKALTFLLSLKLIKNFKICSYFLQPTENSTCISGCKEYDFDDKYTSAVTEYSLICDRRYLSALINTMYFVGVTVGGLLFGIIADKWGRRSTVFICLYCQGILGACLYFSHNVTVFIVLRVLQGFFVQGLQGSMYTLVQEFTPPRHLTFTGFGIEVFWAFGLIYLGGISYFVHDWRLLQLVITLPVLIVTLTWVWLVPESPQFYLVKNRKEAAVNEAFKLASRNKDKTFFDEYQKVTFASKSDAQSAEPIPAGKMIEIFSNKILLKHIIVMILVWYSVSLSYWGILLFMPNLAGSM